MNNKLEIINRDGWRREHPLEKGIIHIGSAANNDIVLDDRYGAGVAPLHAQLIVGANGNPVFKLINLADDDISIKGQAESVLAPRSVLDLTDGLQFSLGEFTLVFHLAPRENAAPAANSRSIGLKLAMPTTHLAPNRSLEGVVTVANLGQRPGVRFDLELEGLEPDCYDLAPGPLLSSGAEKDVPFRLYHRGQKPAAGQWRIVIRATAVGAYPGEQASASQIINVLPFYRHQLRLLPGKGIAPAQAPQPEPGPTAPAEHRVTKSPLATEAGWDLTPKSAAAAVKIRAADPAPPEPVDQPAPIATVPEWWQEPEAELPPPQVQPPPSPEAEAWWSSPDVGSPAPPEDEPPAPAEPPPAYQAEPSADSLELPAESTAETAAEDSNVENGVLPEPHEDQGHDTILGRSSSGEENQKNVDPGAENWWDQAIQPEPDPARSTQPLKLKATVLPEQPQPPAEEEADW